MVTLRRRTGFEIELLAPPGRDRRDLAERIAREHSGRVRRTFHTDSEPSLVPGMGHFWHLTPGFAVEDASGAPLATLVDDITIAADLRREHEVAGCGTPGHGRCPRCRPVDPERWYRVVSDDARLLRLAADHSDPDAPFPATLDGVAALFGTEVDTVGSIQRLRDRDGASIAMATGLVPGRERPCEVVTPPLTDGHEAALDALLAPARELGFTVPVEAAVHLHVDAGPFRSAPAFANLVRLFGYWREALRDALDTNPACTRLQPLPEALLALVEPVGTDADATTWPELQAAAAQTGITKYFDVNLTALLTDDPPRDTVEVRILPGALHPSEITERAALVEALLDRCEDPTPIPRPSSTDPAELRALAAATPARVSR